MSCKMSTLEKQYTALLRVADQAYDLALEGGGDMAVAQAAWHIAEQSARAAQIREAAGQTLVRDLHDTMAQHHQHALCDD